MALNRRHVVVLHPIPGVGESFSPRGWQTEEVSTTLAREYLLTTERCGLICRDDTVESLSFFPNRFLGHA